MIVKGLMIIWLSAYNNGQTLTVQKFDTVAECVAAKKGIVRHYEDGWVGISDSDIECIPYETVE
jgi:hypothetical protein